MDLSSVTVVGVIAFACFKFAGYCLFFFILKKKQSAIQANTLLMAGARTVLGLIAGGALYFGWDALGHRFSGFYNLSVEFLPHYLVLVLLRIFVWGATIHFFTRKAGLRRGRELLYALGGTIWSSLIDIPAAFLTMFIPGAVLFC
jgi:hypothetical protein